MLPSFSINLRQLPPFNSAAVVFINFTTLTLLFTVIRQSRLKDKQSQIFTLLGVFMLTWVDFAFFARILGFYKEISLFFLRIAWIATPPVFYCTYLISAFVAKGEKHSKLMNWGLLFITLLLSTITALTNLVIEDTKFTEGILDIIYGQGFYPFLAGVFIIMVFTIVPLIKAKLGVSLKLFITGVFIFYIANLIFNIILPVFLGVTRFYFFGDYSTSILLAFTAYAMSRHEFLDIKIISTELLTVMIWIILLARLFVSQGLTQTLTDAITFGVMIIFGILLIRSIIREVKQRQELQILTQKLEEMDTQKDTFISMVAHELRAPMTAIKGYISMVLEGDAGDIPEKARGFLADASSINDRLVRLVNNMLNVSRIEEGRMVYQLEVENLSSAVRTVFNQFVPEAQRKGLSYKLRIAPEVKDTVEVDPDRIQEVIGNFLSNAIKYTEKGSVEVKLTQPDEDTIRCEVIDTGPGISEDEQKQLFQKFHRAQSTVGKTTGTGLGLYISRLLVERFGGKIGVISKEGSGSNFWFELPLVSKSKLTP